MAVVEVKLKFAGCTGRDDVAGLREYITQHLVRTDSAYDGANVVKAAQGVPQYSGFYSIPGGESDPVAFVNDRQADRYGDESELLWVVTTTYKTSTNNGTGEISLIGDPLNIEPQLEWDFHEYQEVAYYAYDHKDRQIPITNSAGDFYDPPLERDEARLILRLTKNEADYNPIKAAYYANAVNSDSWNGFSPLTVLLKPPKAKFTINRGISYWAVIYEMHFKFDGWFKDLWDAGMREYVTNWNLTPDERNGRVKKPKLGYNHMKNDDGSYVTENQLLNLAGRRLVPPGGVLDLREMTPSRLRFRVQKRLPFTPLGIL